MESTLTIDPFAVSVLIGTVMPILVGLVTKLNSSRALKSITLLFLSAAQGAIVNATMADGAAVLSLDTVLVAGLGWVTAVASYYGLLSPTGVSTKVNDKTANLGIGKPVVDKV